MVKDSQYVKDTDYLLYSLDFRAQRIIRRTVNDRSNPKVLLMISTVNGFKKTR